MSLQRNFYGIGVVKKGKLLGLNESPYANQKAGEGWVLSILGVLIVCCLINGGGSC